jgi:phage terminase Nu1 subunit (DNA packaging protein)
MSDIDKDDLKRVLRGICEAIDRVVDEIPFPDDSQYPKLNLQAKLDLIRIDIDIL